MSKKLQQFKIWFNVNERVIMCILIIIAFLLIFSFIQFNIYVHGYSKQIDNRINSINQSK